jgi:radical SAM-linked protein
MSQRRGGDRGTRKPHRPARRPGGAGQQPDAGQLLEVGYRLRWAKRGGARFLSHLDALRALLRALRRAGLPLALSQGYNPHAKIAFASALALGLESEAEFVDVQLTRPLSLAELAQRVTETLPPGFFLREARFAPRGGRALAAYVSVSRHVARPLPGCLLSEQSAAALADRARWFLAQPAVIIERSPDKTVDVRSLVADIRCHVTVGAAGDLDAKQFSAEMSSEWAVEFDLLSGPKGAGRADELLTVLGQDPAGWLVLKTDFWPLVEGMKLSPWQA